MSNLVETERHSIGAMDTVGGRRHLEARKAVAGFHVRDGTDSTNTSMLTEKMRYSSSRSYDGDLPRDGLRRF